MLPSASSQVTVVQVPPTAVSGQEASATSIVGRPEHVSAMNRKYEQHRRQSNQETINI